MGVAEPGGDFRPTARLAGRRSQQGAVRRKKVVDPFQTQRRQKAALRQNGGGQESGNGGRVVARQERKKGSFVLAVTAAQLRQGRHRQRMQRIAGGQRGRVGQVGDAEGFHILGGGLRPPENSFPQPVVPHFEHGPHQSAGLGSRLRERNILETALHFGPLPPLRVIGPRQVILKRQMLQREDENGQTRTLARLRQLLQQVRIGFAAVPDGLQVFAELIDDQQQGRVLRQTTGHFYQSCRGRAGAPGIVRRFVRQGSFQSRGGRKRPGRGNAAVPLQRRPVEGAQDGAAERLAAGGHQAEMKTGGVRSVFFAGFAERLAGGGRSGVHQAESRFLRLAGRSEEGGQQQGQGRFTGTVGAGQRPGSPCSADGGRRRQPVRNVRGAGGDNVAVQGFGVGNVPFQIGGAGETGLR